MFFLRPRRMWVGVGGWVWVFMDGDGWSWVQMAADIVWVGCGSGVVAGEVLQDPGWLTRDEETLHPAPCPKS